MASFLENLNTTLHSVADNLPLLLGIIAGFWLIHFINVALKYRLNYLGIVPRHPASLLGIIFMPFLHGNFSHLLVNTIMLFALSAIVLIDGRDVYFSASICIILICGLLVWLFARHAIHIGASGLVMGYFGFILMNSIAHPSFISIVVAVVCLYFFGSLIINLLPGGKKVSWEGHVFGFIAGVATSFII